jgi:hypothetical protein
MEVIELEGPHPVNGHRTARVYFIGDHPHGYADGTEGRYFIEGPCELLVLEKKR